MTFAGRADVFVIVGRDTYVPVHLYESWRPVHIGDRLDGSRVLNQGGNSKWRATAVARVQRAEGPPPSAHEAWLQRSQDLLGRIERERAGPDSSQSSAKPSSDIATAGLEGATDDDSSIHGAARAASARREAEMLIELALIELRALPEPSAPPLRPTSSRVECHEAAMSAAASGAPDVQAAFLY